MSGQTLVTLLRCHSQDERVRGQALEAHVTCCKHILVAFTSAVAVFLSTAVAHMKALWHLSERVLETSRRMSNTAALLVRSPLLHGTRNAANCVCCVSAFLAQWEHQPSSLSSWPLKELLCKRRWSCCCCCCLCCWCLRSPSWSR